jgi:hypothetical protein
LPGDAFVINPKVAKPRAGFKHDYRAASPKKSHKIITIEKTSTMRKSRGIDLAQWMLHCGGKSQASRGGRGRRDHTMPCEEAWQLARDRRPGVRKALPTDGNRFHRAHDRRGH